MGGLPYLRQLTSALAAAFVVFGAGVVEILRCAQDDNATVRGTYQLSS
jgi:hypothetical protein